ncbi:MAG: hypothetical protein V4719_05140 [Planctomycetota bacterium]
MSNRTYRMLFRIVGLPIALSGIAVALGLLTPLFGLLAAVGLVTEAVLSHWFGDYLFSWGRGGWRSLMIWSVFGIVLGIECGIGMASILGDAGGVVFGVTLSMLVIGIGYLGSQSQQPSA